VIIRFKARHFSLKKAALRAQIGYIYIDLPHSENSIRWQRSVNTSMPTSTTPRACTLSLLPSQMRMLACFTISLPTRLSSRVYLGPGCRIRRAVPVDEPGTAIYEITIWDTWKLFFSILPPEKAGGV